MTNGQSKRLSVHRVLANPRAFLVLFLCLAPLLGASACPNRKQIRASLWTVWPIPSSICEKAPELKPYGLYRKLNSGKWEFIPYCGLVDAPRENHEFFAIYDDDLEKLLDGTLPEDRQ